MSSAALKPKIAPSPHTLSVARHWNRFDPSRFADTRVDVVGCGSVGSRIAMEVAKLGVQNLHLWDFDIVEPHNIANQLFWLSDIGHPKVEALAAQITAACGLVPTIHNERLEKPTVLGKVVFLAVDSMAARKQIFLQSLHLKPTTDVVIEIRMGVEELRVYGFNPRSRAEVKTWESLSNYDDTQTVENACQAQTTIGATAGITACLAVHRFLQWYKRDYVRDPEYNAPDLEQVMMLRPLITTTRGA